jgi:hypothetical protein
MEISQLQLSYVDVEDRMVLRINLGADQHLALVLTRRIVRFMLDSLSVLAQRVTPPPAVRSVLGSDLPSKGGDPLAPQNVPKAPAALGQVGRDDTPFQERAPEGNLLNVGHAAILVANAACQQTESGLTFTFLIEPLQPVNLNLSAHLGLGVSQLMTELSQRAQWFGTTTIGQRDTSQQALMDLMPNQGSVTYH